MKFNVWWQPIYLALLGPIAASFAWSAPPGVMRTVFFVCCLTCLIAATVMAWINLRARRARNKGE
jgi:integral membrane sensor domain MASE1